MGGGKREQIIYSVWHIHRAGKIRRGGLFSKTARGIAKRTWLHERNSAINAAKKGEGGRGKGKKPWTKANREKAIKRGSWA